LNVRAGLETQVPTARNVYYVKIHNAAPGAGVKKIHKTKHKYQYTGNILYHLKAPGKKMATL
jgi:hypothetical protein